MRIRRLALACTFLSFATVAAIAVGCGGGSSKSASPTPTVTPTPPPTPPPTPTPSGTPPAGGSYVPLHSGATWAYATTKTGAANSTKTVTCGPLGDIGGQKAGISGYKLTSTDASGASKFDWDEDRGVVVLRHREQTFAAGGGMTTESYYLPSKLVLDMQSARLVTGATYYERYTEAATLAATGATTTTDHFVTWMVVSTNGSNPSGGSFCPPCLELSRHSQSAGNLSSDKKYYFKQNVGKVEEDTLDAAGAITASETLTSYTP